MHLDPILSLGIIFLSGYGVLKLINVLKIPTVTGDLLLGIIIGEEILNLVSPHILSASSFISNLVLGLIAFAIGQNFSMERFRKLGRSIILISIMEAAGAWITVTLVFHFLLGKELYISLLFGAIASATAPAATVMVIREYRAKGVFTNILLGVVAIDDAWCLMIFSISLAAARALAAHVGGSFLLTSLLKAIIEIFGALALGTVAGVIFNKLSSSVKSAVGAQIYTLGFILTVIGLAIHLKFSILLSSMALGATLVNMKGTSQRYFESIRSIESPLYLLFFVLAGANLELASLKHIGLIGLTYLVARVTGKAVGAAIGGLLSGAPANVRKYMGFALVPQAGVALGVALIAKADFPEFGGTIFDTIVATTVVYELIGPILTKFALTKAGEIKPKNISPED